MIKKQPVVLIMIILAVSLVLADSSVAQDSSKRKTIEITSTFKPVLRDAVKINFNAAPPSVDSSKPTLKYNLPTQNLSFTYVPVMMKPVALDVDSASGWKSSNYIKAGVGNVHIPFLQSGFSFGDGKNAYFNVFAKHLSSKGGLPFQKNSQTAANVEGTYKTIKNLEWNAGVGFKSDDYFFYGYQPSPLVFTKNDLRQRFQTFEGKLSLHNVEPTTYGLNYYPNFKTSVFSGKNDFNKATESNTVLNLPLQKTIGKIFGIKLGFTADLTSYRPSDKSRIQNNLYYFSPSLLLKTPNVYLEGGLIPSWDNGIFTTLPNFMADITTNDKRFTLQVGWIGYYNKGSYERFASINPWIIQPDNLLNTRVQERYAGFKGSVLNHFTYSAKVGFAEYRNMPLFVNDSTDGKTFQTVYSSQLQAIQFHGEIGYTQGETFNATAKLTWNQYSKVKDQTRAWGLLPLEFNVNLNWQVIHNLWLKSELFAWDGAAYRTVTKDARKGDGGFDLNAGLEFKITRQFNLWVQTNNIFNNRYERWNQYQVYGFNMLGGVVFNF
ncbi:MAG: hypothetical protein ABIN89_23520 [Chitinophagaceae bacterium]